MFWEILIMTNIRYKAVCKICAYYSTKNKPENAISDLQNGDGLPPPYQTKKCPNGKHDVQVFEIKEEK